MQVFGIKTGTVSTLAEKLHDSDVKLRWGGQQVAGAINGSVHLLDGLEQLRALYEADVPVPDFTTSLAEAESWLRDGSLVLGRKLNHTQGRDIICAGENLLRGRLETIKRWKARDFWTRYTPALLEWRFHILNGESIARACKVWAGQGPEPTEHPLIRSRRLGWHMAHDIEPPKGARSAAKAAVKAVGYDLGAVDLLEISKGKFLILEVNSRPALRDDYTLQRYALALGGR